MVSADNPVHYWRLADPGGYLANDIGSSRLTLTAGKFLASVPYTGPTSDGGSAFFTNTANYDYNDLATLSFPISLEAWYFQIQRAVRDQYVFTLESTVGGANPSLGMGLTTTGLPRLTSNNSGLASAATTAVSHWHHLVATHSGTQRKLYVDSVNVATDSQTFASANSGFFIGARGGAADNYFEGLIAEVAYYHATLTQAQISAHYAAADNANSSPVYRPLGNYNPTTGGSVVSQETIDLILSSVRKSYVAP